MQRALKTRSSTPFDSVELCRPRRILYIGRYLVHGMLLSFLFIYSLPCLWLDRVTLSENVCRSGDNLWMLVFSFHHVGLSYQTSSDLVPSAFTCWATLLSPYYTLKNTHSILFSIMCMCAYMGMCMHVCTYTYIGVLCLHMCVCIITHECRSSQRPEALDPAGAKVTNDWKSPNLVAGNCTWVLKEH